MKNKYWFLSIIILFSYIVVGCFNSFENDEKDNTLNGIWVNNEKKLQIKFNNGNVESSQNDITFFRGTYTINDSNNLTVQQTHSYISIGIENASQWYTENEFKKALENLLKEIGLSEEDINSSINIYFQPETFTYILNENTLILLSIQTEHETKLIRKN